MVGCSAGIRVGQRVIDCCKLSSVGGLAATAEASGAIDRLSIDGESRSVWMIGLLALLSVTGVGSGRLNTVVWQKCEPECF